MMCGVNFKRVSLRCVTGYWLCCIIIDAVQSQLETFLSVVCYRLQAMLNSNRC